MEPPPEYVHPGQPVDPEARAAITNPYTREKHELPPPPAYSLFKPHVHSLLDGMISITMTSATEFNGIHGAIEATSRANCSIELRREGNSLNNDYHLYGSNEMDPIAFFRVQRDECSCTENESRSIECPPGYEIVNSTVEQDWSSNFIYHGRIPGEGEVMEQPAYSDGASDKSGPVYCRGIKIGDASSPDAFEGDLARISFTSEATALDKLMMIDLCLCKIDASETRNPARFCEIL